MDSISNRYPEIHRAEMAARFFSICAGAALLATMVTVGLALADKVSPLVPGCCFGTTLAVTLPLAAILKYQMIKANQYNVNLHELYAEDSVHEVLIEPILSKLRPIRA